MATFHFYPITFDSQIIKSLVKNADFPYTLACLETGFPARVLGFDISSHSDDHLYQLLRKLFLSIFYVKDGKVHIEVDLIGLWKIEDCNDGYLNLLITSFPKSYYLIRQYQDVLKKMAN
ncbi:hypothetical protein HY612_05590 [Candidatus Roizmanbacteria bacterium]|nr:hypothetical protein [Candidatus Roizmanbacteria bacterium]